MLKQGFQQAQNITRANARTFYLTSFFLPKRLRLAAYSIYAVCRISDESVDDLCYPLKDRQCALQKIRDHVDLAYSQHALTDPLLCSFRHTVEEFHIPQKYFLELLEGMAMDLQKCRYLTFHELYAYCYRVAGVIGLIMLKVFACQKHEAEQYAIDLGIALQLTNILRDIHEDFLRGRVYLPQEEMQRFHLTDTDISGQVVNEEFKNFMKFQIKRARNYFQRASQGLACIEDRRCRYVAFLILELYAKILEKIETNNFDVYRKRVSIPIGERILSLLSLTCRFAGRTLSFKA